MSERSSRPEISNLNIPMDVWTQPFWDATKKQRLQLPHCASCGRYRWPPSPMCPTCHLQHVIWSDAGDGEIFSFTIVHTKATTEKPASILIPALIEFPNAGGVRLPGAIVDASIERVHIGATVLPVWEPAADAIVPMFKLCGD